MILCYTYSMKDKQTQVRDHLLGEIEAGRLPAGSKLPGARELAAELGISFLMVQQAVSSLEQDGILETIPRRGAFVRHDWQQRLLRNQIWIFTDDLPWIGKVKPLLEEELPELRICRGFTTGMFEIGTTFYVQRHRDEFMDLAPLLPPEFREEGRYFSAPMRGFSEADGRIFGVPFIFSPRVMFIHEEMFAAAGIPLPDARWSWNDFLRLVAELGRHYPADQIINYCPNPYFWMNFIFRAGGKLIERLPDGSSRIALLDPETLRGIGLVRELRSRVDYTWPLVANFAPRMAGGKLALAIADREFAYRLRQTGFDGWRTLPLPVIPGGADMMAQATDLICIRKECADNRLAARFLRFMLGEKMQSFIGGEGYGIPILRRAAMASLNPEDPRDMLFLDQMSRMSALYNVDSPVTSELILAGVNRVIDSRVPIELEMRKLAAALGTIREIRESIPRLNEANPLAEFQYGGIR